MKAKTKTKTKVKAKKKTQASGTANNPGWAFTVRVDGNDLVVEGQRATCWGGFDDPEDNGQTASGMSTRHVPEPFGVALPVLPNVASTAGSPLPLLPWGTVVLVTWANTTGGGSFYAPLIDNGPARSTGNAIDLTPRCARLIDPAATASSFGAVVSYRVLGGAAFVV
jgi:hypothetical protein